MLRRLIRSCAVSFVYLPYIFFLRLIGPYPALAVSRLSALLHDISTYFGTERQVRQALDRAFGSFRSGVGKRSILRRYLKSKHQRFVEWYLYPTKRGRKFVARSYSDAEGSEHIDQALSQGQGAIILVFHYGMAKIVWPALKALGYDNYQHVFRGATYADGTYEAVAKLAMKVLADTERDSGLNLVYHRPFFTLEQLFRLLKKNQLVGMNGDGMMGSDFVSVPFLNGRMQFPTGPARLAARTGAPIIPTYAMTQGYGRHRLVFHAPIYCREDRPEHVERCVTDYVEILDDYVRQYPWEWWTWRRLDITETGDGEILYSARALGTDDGTYHVHREGGREQVLRAGENRGRP